MNSNSFFATSRSRNTTAGGHDSPVIISLTDEIQPGETALSSSISLKQSTSVSPASSSTSAEEEEGKQPRPPGSVSPNSSAIVSPLTGVTTVMSSSLATDDMSACQHPDSSPSRRGTVSKEATDTFQVQVSRAEENQEILYESSDPSKMF